jgi:hypothetical protein
MLKEQLQEAETAKEEALEKLKNSDSQKMNLLQQKEDAFMFREQELEA